VSCRKLPDRHGGGRSALENARTILKLSLMAAMLKHEPSLLARSRLPFVDALRAAVATLVAWHHFVLYGSALEVRLPFSERLVDLLRNHRSIVQVFFVVSGFVMAESMSRHRWNCRRIGEFVVRRYCRLGLPYLAALLLALGACAWGHGWLPERVVGQPPTLGQILAHIVFLQDILGYESLSAGFWFVCIDFQLGLIYVVMLYFRDRSASLLGREPGEGSTDLLLGLGYLLAVPCLFFFNLDSRFDPWAVYFFGQFFLGVVIYHSLHEAGFKGAFALYVLTMLAALALSWRWRLATSLATGLMLFGAGRFGLLTRWPASRMVAYLGRTAYSLFLIHFPVMVLVFTIWARSGWMTPEHQMIAMFAMTYLASLVAAGAFYRTIEMPAIKLSKKFG
jgi:peptidoglycan/LPS O-acetylase OafA/YrhL